MKPHERIIFALDVPSAQEATYFVDQLGGHVGAFKVGLELFIAEGPSVLRVCDTSRVMLDLKLHDIPETVERAVTRAANLPGVDYLTIHVQQKSTLSRAAEVATRFGLQLLGVTVLTSMTQYDLEDMRHSFTDPSDMALYRAQFAWGNGITGFVCSPHEVSRMRRTFPKAIIVTPGIRPAGAAKADQRRTGTPAQAIQDGADYIVVGRPIRDAENPTAAADAIAEEIAEATR